jgi:two-component system, LytTR family, sensor kinase
MKRLPPPAPPQSSTRRRWRLALALALSLSVLVGGIQFLTNRLVLRDAPQAGAPGFLELISLWALPEVAAWMVLTWALMRITPAFAARSDRIGARWVGYWLLASVVFALLHVAVSAAAGLWLSAATSEARQLHAALGADSPWDIFLLECGRRLRQSAWLAMLLVLAHRRESERQRLRNAELSLHLGRARMDALAARLNPHFLFNALHTVSALVHADPDRAVGGIARLGEVLRGALESSERHVVPLRDEVRFARDYLAIECLRFGERLRCEWRIAPAAEPVPVPPFLLQPLVENAVKYGVDASSGTTMIVIAARIEDARLWIEVAHRGEGAGSGAARDGLGLGISTLRERLDAVYGAAAWAIRQTLAADASETVLVLPLAPPPELATVLDAGFPANEAGTARIATHK